jgi:HTH-type transcriptional regulator/antitoxin MqsA
VEYNGHTGNIPFHSAKCGTCGSEYTDATDARLNKRAMLAFRKEVDGLLTGTQIQAIRKHYGISQAQAAAIFGGGPVAFSKYENDDVAQSGSMDKLLRLASALPPAFSWLAREAGESDVADKSFQQAFEQVMSAMQRKRTLPIEAKLFSGTGIEGGTLVVGQPSANDHNYGCDLAVAGG